MNKEKIMAIESAANKLLEIKNVISELEKEAKLYEVELKELVGESEDIFYAGERRVSYKSESRSGIDSKRLKEERADVYEEYCKVSCFRKLLVK